MIVPQTGSQTQVRAKTMKLLEEYVRINLHDLGLGNNFFNVTQKAKQ